MRNPLLSALVAAAVILSGCDTLNDAVPPVSVSGGVFGLNGTTGVELSGVFTPAGKTEALAATAVFTLNETFDDVAAGDFGEIDELTTHLGIAVASGDAALTLVNTGGGSYPASVTATAFALDFSISDVHTTLGPPWDLYAGTFVTFSRSPSCSDAASECAYFVSAGAVDELSELFPIEITSDENAAYLATLSDVVFREDGEPNTVNTLQVALAVQLTNAVSEFDGLEARIRVGEYETQVRPVIF